MTDELPYKAFDRPDASAVVEIRSIGPTLYATVTADAVSSVEVGALRDALHGAIASAPEGGLRHMVLDMERVMFINSEAIGMLVTTHSSATNRGAKLVLAAVTDPVLEILHVTKMNTVLSVCRTSEELDAALRSTQ